MEFPFGKAPLAILVLAILTGGAVLWRNHHGDMSGSGRPDLIFVIFSKEHALAYRPAIDQFEKENHVRVQLQVVAQQALQGRLQSAMQVGADVPDMVELLDGSMGVFTKGGLDHIGFVDLNAKLQSTGLRDRLVQSRFSKWSSRGHVFALPHDVHPMMLCYRRDIVESLGIDVKKLTTWDEFARVGRERVTKDLDGNGIPDRYMMDLPSGGEDPLQALMLQHGGGMFDEAGNVIFDSDETLDTICWYVKQIQGPGRIAFPCGWGQNLAKALNEGLILFIVCPDWRTAQFEMDVPSLAGKLALMPLPAWKEGGLRTSTWGGTGLAFLKQGKNFDLAWRLAMHLYYDPDQLGPRFLDTNILPPLKEAWTQPQFSRVNPYWGVSLGQTYIPFATQVPDAPSSAYQYVANGKLYEAFTLASQYYASRGEDGLRDYTRAQLHRCADEVRRIIARNLFYKAEQTSPEVPPATASVPR